MPIIGDQVVQDITGNDDITFEQVQALNEVADRNTDVAALLSEDGDIAGLDAELEAELREVASSTGIG